MVHFTYNPNDKVAACGANKLRAEWAADADSLSHVISLCQCVTCVREALIDARGTVDEATRRLSELGEPIRE